MTDSYRSFLEAKVKLAPARGFDIDLAEINPLLKLHQRLMVQWAVRGGCRAIFAAFGLGKSVIQIEIVRIVLARLGRGRGLLVAPLGVRQEFLKDVHLLATGDHPDITDEQRVELRRWQAGRPDRIPAITFVRRSAEVAGAGLFLTNYESIRDGRLDSGLFDVASLDEASCLRGFGGSKTFREFIRRFAPAIRYRFLATATPSPNEYIELLAYAAFLDIMDVGQAKTRFFKRDSEKADSLTIHPHKVEEFWLWVASWGLFVQRPSDLGCSDQGYELPPLTIQWHELPTDHSKAMADRSGQGQMFLDAAKGVIDASREKRDSLQARVTKLMEIVRAQRGRTKGLSEGLLSEEPGTLAGETKGAWQAQLLGQAERVQSQGPALARDEPRTVARAAGSISPGECRDHPAAQQGLVCQQQATGKRAEPPAEAERLRPDGAAVPGNAGIPEWAMRDMQRRSAIQERQGELPGGSRLPDRSGAGPALPLMQCGTGPVSGQSGRRPCGSELPEQLVIWCDLNDEQRLIERGLRAEGLGVSSLFGNQDIEQREQLLSAWKSNETTVFLSKPSMYGAGVNLQQAHTMMFVGVGFKAQDFLQAIHRIHRFLQKNPCTVHIIYTQGEREVRRSLERKWKRHDEMVAKMSEIIRQYGLSEAAMARALTRSLGVERVEVAGERYRLINEDAVNETKRMEEGSVDLIVTSIPFATQYEYSPNYADFGHTDDNEHFWRQMDFLTPELLRVLEPGRVAAIHVKDRIVPGGINGLGFQTVRAFSDECREHFEQHGWAFLARKTVVTDVVRENNQTYRLGWTEQCKDGSRMGAGMPEYVLLFRKPPSDTSDGYADAPVVKPKKEWDGDHWVNPDGYSRARWQFDAHGFMRSSGDRLLTPDDIVGLKADQIFKLFRQHSLTSVYNFEHDVALAEALEQRGQLPPTFMLLQPQSWHPDVWTDITRMLTLNGQQHAKGRELHLCPLQFDIVDRLITQLSMPDEVVFDPFGGLMTVPYRALKLGRRGVGIELSPRYFLDGVAYVEAMAREVAVPTLFDLLTGGEDAAA